MRHPPIAQLSFFLGSARSEKKRELPSRCGLSLSWGWNGYYQASFLVAVWPGQKTLRRFPWWSASDAAHAVGPRVPVSHGIARVILGVEGLWCRFVFALLLRWGDREANVSIDLVNEVDAVLTGFLSLIPSLRRNLKHSP